MKNIYGKFRDNLNPVYQGKLTKLAFILANKPIVKKDDLDPSRKFPNSEKGGVIISADFEMSWAWRYTKTGSNYLKRGQIERENFPKIIELLHKYNIPITFATVGHLFLNSCDQGDHNWMNRVPHFDDHWKFNSGDWFDHDPNSDYKNAPEWYAPDLIQLIIDSDVGHEIGTHTFSHIDFSYRNCPPEVADDDIKACIEAAKRIGVELKSIVFPGGTWGNIEILKKHDINIYRKRENVELAYPYRDEQDILVTTSSGCLEYNLNFGWAPQYFISRLKKYVNKAIETNTIAHFWFHPSLEPFILENILPDIFEYIAEKRETGELWIGPMNSIANHINNNNLLP